MHFSKTYAQLLLSLPQELRQNAIEYRQLKKLINQIVRELSSLGLSPAVLQELLDNSGDETTQDANNSSEVMSTSRRYNMPRIVYEVAGESGRIEPQLRMWVEHLSMPNSGSSTSSLDVQELGSSSETEADPEDDKLHSEVRGAFERSHISLLWALQRATISESDHCMVGPSTTDAVGVNQSKYLEANPAPSSHDRVPNEMIIPLVSDTAFFQMLSDAIEGLSTHLATVQSNFVITLEELSRTISDSARPSSSTTSFHPYSSVTSNAGSIGYSAHKSKSDLYSWREIFQLYIEAEVFENMSEVNRGERSVDESELRLKLFAERVTKRGLGDGRKLRLKQSREALETFLELNVFILNIKKFQLANAEATRKILKKHAKRTALPYFQNDQAEPQSLLPRAHLASLPRVLVQAIGATLLPIIPHLDDYTCLICTSIAFKPIRLNCGHLFCVRCLVKMQKRGKGDCPMCRAPCVLVADRSNVDWALVNFMQDWFPLESKEKLKNNEKEAAREEIEELGFDPDQPCVVM